MQFEVLHRSKKKKFLIAGCLVVVVLLAIVFSISFAKYRVTKSMQLMTGTINFSPYDFNLVAMYLDKGGALPAGQTEVVPKIGYDLDMENSACYVGDAKDDTIAITYVPKVDGTATPASLSFDNMTKSGTKCTIHFKLKDDTQNPSITISTSSDDTSITVNANATDDVGVYYYYYKLDNGEEVRSEDPTYKFEGLNKDQTYTISVRVVDAAGNEASATDEVTVGLRAGDVILAHYSTVLTRTNFSSTVTNTTTGTIYKSANANQYDNDGEVYYFAGNPTDNWFQFGTNSSGQPLYWRIVRINGDGSVRLIYNGTSTATTGNSTMINTSQAFNSSYNNNAYVGYMYTSGNPHGLSTNSSIKTKLDEWYLANLVDEAEYLDGNAGFCGDRYPSTSSSSSNGSGGTGTTTTYYGAYIRLVSGKNPSFKCTDKDNDLYTTPGSSKGNGALKVTLGENNSTATPIGLITADEVAFAGGVYGSSNSRYYLYNNANYWTVSPYYYNGRAYVFNVASNGSLNWNYVIYTRGVRPVINLKSAIAITGSGTTGDPFKVG